MEQQMNTILLLLIFTGLVAMLLVVFFMLDRLNDLHRKAGLPAGVQDAAEAFGGLSGKPLWDAMIGVPLPGWDAARIAVLRPRYELVLQKHLEMLFEDGRLDGREGFSMPVKCDRRVPTLRGEVESWMPHEFASGIYRSGHALATAGEDGHEAIRRQVDAIGSAIFSSTGLPPHRLSALLMPQAGDPAPEDSSAGDAEPATPAAVSAAAAAGAAAYAAASAGESGEDGDLPEATAPAALPAPFEAEVIEPVSLPAPETVRAAEASGQRSDTAPAG